MEMSFEDKLKRLEQIVAELEGGALSLEDSLKLFDEGTKLIGQCNETLEKAEQKVVRITKGADGEPVESPFE